MRWISWFSEECGWDDGDCTNCIDIKSRLDQKKSMNTLSSMSAMGYVTGNLYIEVCAFEGGDCAEFNEKFPDCRMGDFSCSSFNRTFPGCIVDMPEFLGNGMRCDGNLNNAECNWDGGDCLSFNYQFVEWVTYLALLFTTYILGVLKTSFHGIISSKR